MSECHQKMKTDNINVSIEYKKFTAEIEYFYVSENKLFILINSEVWIIDHSGKQYPNIDLSGIEVDQIKLLRKKMFIITKSKEIFVCRLGESRVHRMSISFNKIKIDRNIVFSLENKLFWLKDCIGSGFRYIFFFDNVIQDFEITKKKTFVILQGKTFCSPTNKHENYRNNFKPIEYLQNVSCLKLYKNVLDIVFAETQDHLVALFERKPILIFKPKLCYDVCFTKYQIVFLSERIHILSIFTGKTDKVICLTGFKVSFDTLTGCLWVYSGAFFAIRIYVPIHVLLQNLIGQDMYKYAIRISCGKDITAIKKYALYLFSIKRFKRAFRYFAISDSYFHFDQKEFSVGYSSQTNRSFLTKFYYTQEKFAYVPNRLILKFLFKIVPYKTQYMEFLAKELFLRREFLLLKQLIKKISKSKLKILFIENHVPVNCCKEQKEVIETHKLYTDPESFVLKKLFSNKFREARRSFIKAHLKKIIDQKSYINLMELLLFVESKALTRIFIEKNGKKCLEFMYNKSVYIN